MKKVNCIFFGDFGRCGNRECEHNNKQCIEYYGTKRCDFREDHKRPDPPTAPPRQFYKT